MSECCRTNYPDRAVQTATEILDNEQVARDTYRVRLRCPEIARRIVPGQFVMLRLAGWNDPLLGRPLAMCDVYGPPGEPEGLEIVYLVVGKMTRRLAQLKPGTPLEIWGPLGNGFAPHAEGHLIMVAGGIGQTPMLALAKETLRRQGYGDPVREVGPGKPRVTLCYGARSAEFLACVDDFRRVDVEVCLSTDDGSAGHHGRVTELVPPLVDRSGPGCRIVACGPEPMLAATARVAKQLGVPCEISLESPMACGIGICFSCVTKIRDGAGEWDYRRVCVEGPVFRAEDVEF